MSGCKGFGEKGMGMVSGVQRFWGKGKGEGEWRPAGIGVGAGCKGFIFCFRFN